MLKRPREVESISKALKRSRVVCLIGPRQCGKTTIARQFVPLESANYFDLENPRSLARLEEPLTALEPLRGLVVIDEIQRRPELFPVFRVLVDRKPLPARFLILGSASPALLKQSSETLAGRIEVITLSGFSLTEVGTAKMAGHWLRGGFPLAWLAKSNTNSFVWRTQFVQTFLERDLPMLGFSSSTQTLSRFLRMVAHYHGQIWNSAEPARSLGIGETTVRRYLDLFTDVFMIRQIQPFVANLKKRQVKAPKVYFRDSGILHGLLDIRQEKDLLEHPKCGASWEGYVIEEILKAVSPDQFFYWATHNGAELDLLLIKGSKKIGVECKRTDSPKITPSIRTALQDLQLKKVFIVYPGTQRFSLSPEVTAVPAVDIPETLKSLS